MIRYFKKELVANRIKDAQGREIPWEYVNGSTGLAAFDMDDPVQHSYIEALDELVGRGGVIALSGEEEYEGVKKKLQSISSPRAPKAPAIKIFHPPYPGRDRRNAERAAETGTDKTEPKSPVPPPQKPKPQTEPTAAVKTESVPWAEESPRTEMIP